jgi:hypothetical protein
MLTLDRRKLILVVALQAACGGSGAGAIDGEKQGVGDGGVVVLPDGAIITPGADGGVSSACKTFGTGVVDLTVTPPSPSSQSEIFARFQQTLGANAASDECTAEQFGACVLRVCPPRYGVDPVDDGTRCTLPPGWPSAGTLSIKGGANADVTMSPDKSGGYLSFAEKGAHWSGGDALTIASSGAVVPAFSTAIQFPSAVVLPPGDPFLSDGTVSISQSHPLTLKWTAGVGLVELVLDHGGTPGMNQERIECRFDSSAATGTVPVEALAKLPPPPAAGTASYSGYLRLRAVAENAIKAGNFDIKVTAQQLTPNRTYLLEP